jgi:hypothetical protein
MLDGCQINTEAAEEAGALLRHLTAVLGKNNPSSRH